MADLFDMKVGGLGFHLTAHMIALAALFVACFAITGYISFRDGSISEKKLDGANFLTDGEAMTSLTMGSLVEKVYYKRFSSLGTTAAGGVDESLGPITDALPVGAVITQVVAHVVTAGANFGNLELGLNTVANTGAFGVAATTTAGLGMACDSDVTGTTAAGQGGLAVTAVAGLIPTLIGTINVTPLNTEVFDVYLTVSYPLGVTPL